MIVPDANLLLYAYDSTNPFHERARSWWRACLNGTTPVGLCAPVVFAFLRIGTSRRAFADPLEIGEATGHVRGWLERSVTEFLIPEEADLHRAIDWLDSLGSGANLTTDAQIAAIAARHRAVVHTSDTDFQRFSGVRWMNPLQADT